MSTREFIWPTSSIIVPLPTGAATSANQVTEIAKLTSIDGKIPALGQAAMAASLPVTIASNQSDVPVKIDQAVGLYDASNSTTTPLGISGNFTGTWVDASNYATIQVGVYTDQNSTSLGFKIEFSANGSTVAHTHSYTYESSSNGTGYSFQPEFKYFRVNYTNDGVAQSYLTIYTALKPVSLIPSSYRVEQAITGQSQALVTKGVIYGLTTGGGGGYVAVKVTPSGAMNTATTLDAGTNIIGKVGIDQTTNGTTNAVYVNNFPASQAITGTVAATQSGTWNINNISGTLSLPTGAATETTLADVRTSVQLIDNAVGTVAAGTAGSNSLLTGGVYNSSAPTLTTGQQVALQLDSSGNLKTTATFTGSIGAVNQGTANTVANAWPILMTDGTNTASVKAASTAAVAGDKAVVVALSPNTPTPKATGLSSANAPIYNAYASTSITTSAYTQLIASTTSATTWIDIFDSSGQGMILATGAAGSEVIQAYIPPGGDAFSFAIPASTRVAYKALTANATSGYLLLNLRG